MLELYRNINLFACPECGANLELNDNSLVCSMNHRFPIRDGVINFLPQQLSKITAGDAHFHNLVKQEWVEINQIDTLRNLYYHREIIDFLFQHSNIKTVILELGGGVGFDLELFIQRAPTFGAYIFSEIHQEMVMFARERIRDKRIIYCLIDAQHLPLHSVDVITMVASLHHLPKLPNVFTKISEIVKPGGYIVCGIEPNRGILGLSRKARETLERKEIIPTWNIPPGDEQTEGFQESDFYELAAANGLEIAYLEPVWFCCGFLHKGIELLYRALKFKKRPRLPFFLERTFIMIDKALLRIPCMRKYSFHYTVIFQKPFSSDQ
jgi:SAM-dependent methyltransferase